MDYPESKRYPELFEKLFNRYVCLKDDRFYIFFNGVIAYAAPDSHWYERQEDGTWKKDYTLERWAEDAAYEMAEISDRIAAEYGFVKPEDLH